MATEPQEIHSKVSIISCWDNLRAVTGYLRELMGGGVQNTGRVQLLRLSYKRGEEDGFVSLTSIPRKIQEQIIKQTICKPLGDNKKMSDSQHGFVSVMG